jgi:dipeptidyl aminopeptidase/acylaminoacyl peptidase
MLVVVVLLARPPIVPAGQSPQKSKAEEPLLTVAERSDFQATGRYDDVMQFCGELAKRSAAVTLTEMGTSSEGRSLPLLILAEPAVANAEQAKRSGKLVALAVGNIHAGEVCGKEALQILAREIAAPAERPLLKDLILLFAPIYNADGNERVSRENRPNQAGPAQGVGARHNAQGLDLNRDHVKLESPEARALARLITRWDPAMVIDCHTTNGSFHRYALTYDGPRHPATHAELAGFTRDELLPEISRRMEEQTGRKTFFYGNFDREHRHWKSYPALPRFNTHYVGLRGRIGILSEAYAYAPFRDRVLATRDFVKHTLLLLAERKRRVSELLAAARAAAKKTVEAAQPAIEVPIRSEPTALGKVTILGYEETLREGKPVRNDRPRDYEVEHFGLERVTRAVARPYAYLVPRGFDSAVENLLRHGADVRVLREDVECDVEVYRIRKLARSGEAFERHHLVSAEVDARSESRRVPAGTTMVRTDQPLGTLVVTLLEPESPDGLAAWGFFDAALAEGDDFPVVRLPHRVPLLTAARTLPRDPPEAKKPITFEVLYGGRRPSLGGSPAGGFRWLDEGEHYLQRKDGQFCKVHAPTGRCEPFSDPAPLAAALEKLDAIDENDAKRLAGRARGQTDRAVEAALIRHHNDLYYATLDGKTAKRLTDSPGVDELATFSPDGRRVAFVRQYDLYVVDVDTGKERRLTEGGSATLRNGKADWVYFEEIYHRSWRAYKWSPDSKSLVFQQFDDSGVESFTVLDHRKVRQNVETERYPLAGQPNPRVRLGVVRAAGGDVRWIDPDSYSPDNMLIVHFGWMPDSRQVYLYVQDRTQRWLDFRRVGVDGGSTTRLFREQTEAWIDNPGDPHFLDDGSFLLPLERDGWKHLYHFAADGKLIRRITEGDWEVRGLKAVNEKDGWIYFTGTRDSHLAENLYRVKLDGAGMTRLTREPGSHRVTVDKRGSLFVDSWSDYQTPTRVSLRRGDGEPVRMLDTNPVPALDEYQLGEVDLFQIPTRDGSELEASLVKPADFDPARKYPVWLQTYGGPHAPSLTNAWRGGRTFEHMLAQMGILAFRCDPRSASGKGARSTWKAYRQLGVAELRDLEDALDWLAKKPYVDASRIGMSGHSYGGFLTAFAMTHGKRLAAGIAGAPVTDWRNYDTIYTERYMSTPQENPEGYEKTSVVAAAKNLHGRLLLIHGARDDNVHLANTLQLVDALQRANKTFELMIYPPNRHGVSGVHYRRLTVDFIRRTMLGGRGDGASKQ